MKRVRIADVCSINPRLPASLALQTDRDVDFVPMASLGEDGRISVNGAKKLGQVLKGYTYFENGDVIVAKITPCMENGKAAHVTGLPNAIAFGSTEFHVLRPNAEIDPRFLFYMVWTPRFRHEATRNMTGTAGQQRVPANFFERFEIPLPPLPHQQWITAILDKADDFRRHQQDSVALIDSLIASEFRERFGDPVTNSQSRSTVPLSAYGTITTGNTPSRKDADNYGDAIEWIKSDNINTPRHIVTKSSEWLSQKGLAVARTVPAGSTLVTCIAGSPSCVGNAGMTDRTVAFNQQINAITPLPTVDPWFLYSLVFLSKPLVQRASTASMKGMVSKGKFEQVHVIEVDSEEQRSFGKAFHKILSSLDRHYLAADEANLLFNSLVQRAFRGEL